MTQLLFVNNFSTTLADPISSSDTTATIVSVAGLPTIVGDQSYRLTFTRADITDLTTEIVNVTARTGNVVTIGRGAEGTTAVAWSAGDYVSQMPTAGSMTAMQQTAGAQSQAANYAVSVGGTANAITAVFSPAIAVAVAGMPLRLTLLSTNTDATTFDPGAGAVSVLAPNGSALQAGDLVAGDVVEFIDDGVNYRVQVVGANTTRFGVTRLATDAETVTGTDQTIAVTPHGLSALGLAPLASPTFTGDPKAPTPSPGDNDTSIATTAFVATATSPFAPLASPALTGSPTAPTQALGDNTTKLATDNFVLANINDAFNSAFGVAKAGVHFTVSGGTLTVVESLSCGITRSGTGAYIVTPTASLKFGYAMFQAGGTNVTGIVPDTTMTSGGNYTFNAVTLANSSTDCPRGLILFF